MIPPSDERPSDDGYIPMTANSGIKAEWNEAYRAGDMEGRRRAEAKLREWLQRVETGEDEGEVKVETDGDIPDSVIEEDGKLAATRSQQQREQSYAVRENEKSRSNRPREVVDLIMSDDSE